jgi:hypothetical protein
MVFRLENALEDETVNRPWRALPAAFWRTWLGARSSQQMRRTTASNICNQRER